MDDEPVEAYFKEEICVKNIPIIINPIISNDYIEPRIKIKEYEVVFLCLSFMICCYALFTLF